MAVRIKFDSSHNVISPTFVLATRGGHKLGPIPAVNISVSDAFNSRFDLEFQVNKNVNGKECPIWDMLTDFKLVWCREWDVWFEMYVTVQDDSDTMKQISCVSVGEAELSQINLYDIEINTEDDIAQDDYVATVLFNADEPRGSLLTRIMEKAPHYTIKHVDANIAKIQRTFTFDGVSIYDAFQEIAEEIDCIFVIDSGSSDDGSINRSISVYDLESYCTQCGTRGNFITQCSNCGGENILHGYGEDTSIFVSTENLADSITLQTDTDSVKNCFRLEAGDDLMTATIKNCNPNGSQYIWYISDDVKKDMSETLVAKLNAYDAMYEQYQKGYGISLQTSLLNQYNTLVDKYKKYNGDLQKIPTTIVGYPELMNAMYSVIDFQLYLHDSMMPSPKLEETDAAKEASRLTTGSLSPVAVQNLRIVSSATATSSVLAMAKTIVNPNYRVKVHTGTLQGAIWNGSFDITNYADEEDTALSEMISVIITDDYETYVMQRIDKVLNNIDDEEKLSDITAIFELNEVGFRDEVKKYCLASLQAMHDACQACLDILIDQGLADKKTWANKSPDLYSKLYVPYYTKLGILASEIKTREGEIAVVAGSYDSDGDLISEGMQTLIEKERKKIQDLLDFEKYLGKNLWLEFSAYRREDTYSNENYISDGLNNAELFSNAREFIEVAQKEIYKSATQQHSLSATLKNLLMMKEFAPIVDKFSVGNWIRIKIDDNVYRLRLISYTIDFEDPENISVEFSDAKKCADGVTDSADILKQAASMASSYDAVARQSESGKKSKKQLDTWVEDGLALTKMKIIDNADNQNVTWDSHGMLFRKYDAVTDSYSDTQLKIINSTLAVTDDNWKTVKTAVGNYFYIDPTDGKLASGYGINAELLIGKMILGENLGIYSGNNSMTFDSGGLNITNGTSTFAVNPNQQKMLRISNKTEDVLWIDERGKLYIKGDGAGIDITANSTTAALSSRITQNAGNITSTVKDLNDAKQNLQSQINQTASSISLTVSNNGKNAGINIQMKNASGQNIGDAVYGSIDLSGLVTFNSLSEKGQTTINGSNITTGEISCDRLKGGTITGQKITGNTISGGTISGSSISGGTISGGTISGSELIGCRLYSPSKEKKRIVINEAGEMFFFNWQYALDANGNERRDIWIPWTRGRCAGQDNGLWGLCNIYGDSRNIIFQFQSDGTNRWEVYLPYRDADGNYLLDWKYVEMDYVNWENPG